MIRAAFAGMLALALAACATTQAAAPAHPEARAYSEKADAAGDVDAALARAAASGKRVLLVLGANWCHDSRALAGWLETPRFAALTAAHYEVVFVDVGVPQTGEGRNLEIARRFGKKLLHVPLSQFSQETISRLRLVHVLNGAQVRSYAADFIRRS